MNLRWIVVLCAAGAGWADEPFRLTRQQAHELARRNNPQAEAARLTARALAQMPQQIRAGLAPTLVGAFTGAGAAPDSRVAAGNLNTPQVYNRMATGVSLSQLITDFGRTSNLAQSANLRAQAEQENANATELQTILQVDQAYFAALRAQAVLRISDQTIAARQLVLDQVTALADAKLKSGLDVSFAAVQVSEAKLLQASARNEWQAAEANLSAALGFPGARTFQLTEEPMPANLQADVAALVTEAIRRRPEWAGRKLELESAMQFVAAEKKLWLPSISAVASAGWIPIHETKLTRGDYSVAGLSVNMPILNGSLFKARRAEAEFRAQAAQQRVRESEVRIARDVTVALLNAQTSQERLGLTAQLLDRASQALDLAQARYELGLSSIVELSQAQLAKTNAELQSATARFDYQLQRAVLDYQTAAVQ